MRAIYLCFVRRVVAFKEACVEASASRTTESPQRARAGSSFPSSGWKKLVAGRLLSATFTMQTMLSYFLDTIAGDGRSSSNFKAISATDNSAMRSLKVRCCRSQPYPMSIHISAA